MPATNTPEKRPRKTQKASPVGQRLLALDPGNRETGWVEFREDASRLGGMQILQTGITPNKELRLAFRTEFAPCDTRLILETPRPRGQLTSAEEMDTLIAVGRFVQEWSRLGGHWSMVFRHVVKSVICQNPNAKDKNILQALKDRFGGESVAVGGNKCSSCHGKGRKGSRRVSCPDCPGRCERCNGKGWFGPGRPVCPKCHGAVCATCGNKGVVMLDEPPVCPQCDGSGYDVPPGPLAEFSSHKWAALAVGCTWLERPNIVQSITADMTKKS